MNWILDLWKKKPEGATKKLPLGAPPVRGKLSVSTQTYRSSDELRKALTDFGGDGWVMFTDNVQSLEASTSVPAGLILAAERVSGDQSLHARRHGDGWATWTYSRILGEEQEGWLFTEQRERIPRGKLIYEVAWLPDDEGIFRPTISRLKAVDPTSAI